jgi:hypothetical protein
VRRKYHVRCDDGREFTVVAEHYGRLNAHEAVRWASSHCALLSTGDWALDDEGTVEPGRNDLSVNEAEAIVCQFFPPRDVYVDATEGFIIETYQKGKGWTHLELEDGLRRVLVLRSDDNFFGDEEAAGEAINGLRQLTPEFAAARYRLTPVKIRTSRKAARR